MKPIITMTALKERLEDVFGRGFDYEYIRRLIGKVRNEIVHDVDRATIEPRLAVLSVIRRWRCRDHHSIREIPRRRGLSRNTVRKYLRSDIIEPKFNVADRASSSIPTPTSCRISQLDRLYQRIVDDLDALIHAVGLKAA